MLQNPCLPCAPGTFPLPTSCIPRAKHLQLCTRSQLTQPFRGLASLHKRKPRKPILAKLPANYCRDWKARQPQFKPYFQASKTAVQLVMLSRSQAAIQESMFPKKTNKSNKQKAKKSQVSVLPESRTFSYKTIYLEDSMATLL